MLSTQDHSLPWPGVPWYGFDVSLIAPFPPPADEELGLNPDMGTPIYPNPTHPNGRAPVIPQPPGSFPYSNCYHWPGMELDIRMLARPEGFDRAKTVRLPPKELLKLMRCVAEDEGNRSAALRARDVAAGHSSPVSADHDKDVPHVSDPDAHPVAEGDAAHEVDDHSIRTLSSGYSGSSSGSEGSVNMMDGFFGDPTQNVEILPLVHLWVDMAANVKQEDIPDPRGMLEERDTIIRQVFSYGMTHTMSCVADTLLV